MTRVLANLPVRLRSCRGVLVDSNVLLDIITSDPRWSAWSGRAARGDWLAEFGSRAESASIKQKRPPD